MLFKQKALYMLGVNIGVFYLWSIYFELLIIYMITTVPFREFS